jgi:hypothetical protein
VAGVGDEECLHNFGKERFWITGTEKVVLYGWMLGRWVLKKEGDYN